MRFIAFAQSGGHRATQLVERAPVAQSTARPDSQKLLVQVFKELSTDIPASHEHTRAIYARNLKWVQAFLEAGANPNKRYSDIETFNGIDAAVGCEDAAFLKLVLQYARRPPKPEHLIRASRMGNLEVFKVLEEHGLKPNEKHLTAAVTHRHAPLVKHLLSLGIRPNNQAIRRAAGIVPRSLAGVPRDVSRPILRMLKQAGAKPPDVQVAKVMASL